MRRTRIVELPDVLGAALWLAKGLAKGASHKYLRRVTTGRMTRSGRQVYRYYYRVTGGAGLGHHDELRVGSKLAVKDAGKGGHFEVVDDHGDGLVTIRHDETGRVERLDRGTLAALLLAEHGPKLTADRGRAAADREDARAHGTSAQARDRVDAPPAPVDEPPTAAAVGGPQTNSPTGDDHILTSDYLGQAGAGVPLATVQTGDGSLGPISYKMTLGQVETAIANAGVEYAVAIRAGRQILRMTSNHPRSIRFGRGTGKLLRNSVLTHNHSNGSPPSPADLVTAWECDVAELRVSGPGIRFSMERPEGGWTLGGMTPEDFAVSVAAIAREAGRQFDGTMGRERQVAIRAGDGYTQEELMHRGIAVARALNLMSAAKGLGWEVHHETAVTKSISAVETRLAPSGDAGHRLSFSPVAGGTGEADGERPTDRDSPPRLRPGNGEAGRPIGAAGRREPQGLKRLHLTLALRKSDPPPTSSPAPTEAQKKAGNYPKRRVRFAGLPISIEQEAGSVREGTDPQGRPWRTVMVYPYGYIRGSKGYDGDHVDVFLGPDEAARYVYVVHQVDPATGKFDEDKCFVGFATETAALAAYHTHYDRPNDFYGGHTAVPLALFRAVVQDQSTPAVIPGTRAAIDRGGMP